jgi:hypothetical protein
MSTPTGIVSAEPGWRALFATPDGTSTGRSRVIAWALVDESGETRLVGMIADPTDPKRIVSADAVVDQDGGSLQRYGFVE